MKKMIFMAAILSAAVCFTSCKPVEKEPITVEKSMLVDLENTNFFSMPIDAQVDVTLTAETNAIYSSVLLGPLVGIQIDPTTGSSIELEAKNGRKIQYAEFRYSAEYNSPINSENNFNAKESTSGLAFDSTDVYVRYAGKARKNVVLKCDLNTRKMNFLGVKVIYQ